MTDASIKQYLSEQPFFAGLAPEFIDFLASCAARRDVGKNEVLFRYDTRAEKFHVLCEGRISIEVAAIEGPPLELQELGPGSVLGWSWLIAPYRWSFQARAEEASEVIEFDGRAVLQRCEEDPKFGYELFKRFSSLMSERLAFARRKMMDEWSPAGWA